MSLTASSAPGGGRGATLARLAGFLLLYPACGVLLYQSFLGNDDILSVDVFYHYVVAEKILEDGLWADISWLPFTVLGEAGTDHHWLFHLLIVPFAVLDDRVLGLKLSVVVIALLALAAVHLLFRRLAIPHAWLFAALAMSASLDLPGRFLMLRAQTLALVLFLLVFLLSRDRRYGWLALVSLLFMLSYHGALFVVAIAGLFVLVELYYDRTLDAKLGIAVGSGLLLGTLVSPWFPDNVEYLLFHVFFKGGNADTGLVGTEWYPPSLLELWLLSWPVFLLLGGAVALYLVQRSRGFAVVPGRDTQVALLLSGLYLVMYLGAVRFQEYHTPFTLLAAGLLCRDARLPARSHWLAPLLVLVLVMGVWMNLALWQSRLRAQIQASTAFTSEIQRNVPVGSLLINSEWSSFQQLVWWLPEYRYANGLDGNYLLYGSPGKFGLWRQLSDGRGPQAADYFQRLRQAFASPWLLFRTRDPGAAPALAAARAADDVYLVLEDGGLALFYIDAPVAPFPSAVP